MQQKPVIFANPIAETGTTMTRPAIRSNAVSNPASNTTARNPHDQARDEITTGLNAHRAFVSPKYLYDPLGSRLFEAITDLPEYYPTRTERAIFAQHAADMARAAGTGSTFIDLGAGNCEKARSLFDAFRPEQYVAIDISADFLDGALETLRRQFPAMDIQGLGMDFSAGLDLPATLNAHRRLFFYPGSSIGNFPPLSALALLTDIRRHCSASSNDMPGGGLLIGFDLVKDTTVLEAAYDDALGVTAAFNLNLLNHLNALIGSNFNVRDWRHRAVFNTRLSRIEMHLEAKRDLVVAWPDGVRAFREGEGIHTESSYKYALPEIRGLLMQAGFRDVRTWTDDAGWFAVCHAVI